MKKTLITIVKLFPKGDEKNYIGYDADDNAYDIQTYFNIANTPRYYHAGKGPIHLHPYMIITESRFEYSRNAEKEVYKPKKEHFILDIK